LQSVDELSASIRKGPIAIQQEGAVLTFVKVGKAGPHQNKVISMGKVKCHEL
jgi:hypothetical protein